MERVLSEQENVRRQKLEEIKKVCNPYPSKFERTHTRFYNAFIVWLALYSKGKNFHLLILVIFSVHPKIGLYMYHKALII